MAAASEIYSFVVKFKCLWQNGFDAKLDIKAENGRASVSLRLKLDGKPASKFMSNLHGL